jgi:hypothetical protein
MEENETWKNKIAFVISMFLEIDNAIVYATKIVQEE